MAAKKPEYIPLSVLLRFERKLPEHRRKRVRKERESRISTDGRSLADIIDDEYVRLADADNRHREAQAQKALKPRGAIDGRTMAAVVGELERHHRDEDPRDVWPHLQRAIEEWAGECESVGTEEKPVYRYPFDGKKDRRTISYKQFRELLRKARETAM